MNAWKGGERALLRELRRVLREQEELQNEVAEVAGVLAEQR